MYPKTLLNHLPVLYTIIPLLAGLLIIIIANKTFARRLLLISNITLFTLALYGYLNYNGTTYYALGDWLQPVGIQFKYDKLAATSLVILSFLMLFCSVFTVNAMTSQVEAIIKPGRRHLPTIILLLLHFGAAGLILTNDLFNLYIFIEIFSLASYTLITISPNPRSYIGAFDYLLIGTIGATLILIAIGLFLALTGTLNLTSLKIIFQHNTLLFTSNKLFMAGSTLLIIGCLIKIGFLPFHFWQIKAYIYSSPISVLYLSGMSNFVWLVVLIKLLFQLLQPCHLTTKPLLIHTIAMFCIAAGAMIAYLQEELRRILVYSAISQAGYYFLLWPFNTDVSFALLMLMAVSDNFSKTGYFLFLTSLNLSNINPIIQHLTGIAKSNKKLCIGVCILLINSAGLPITYGFINKTSIIEHLVKSNFYLAVTTVAVSSFLSVLYSFKIGNQFFQSAEAVIHYKVDKLASIGTVCCGILTIILVFNYNKFESIGILIFHELNAVG